MDFKVITDVAQEPVTLAEARLQCKLDSDDTSHDARLTEMITEARESCEHDAGRAFAPRTLEAVLDAFPSEEFIDLPMPPVTSVTSIKYTDTSGVEQTLSSAAYTLSEYGNARRVFLNYGYSWPSTQCVRNAVRIRFVCGYVTLPKAAKDAMLLDIELHSPLNPFTPQEREALESARDARLDTIKVWGC